MRSGHGQLLPGFALRGLIQRKEPLTQVLDQRFIAQRLTSDDFHQATDGQSLSLLMDILSPDQNPAQNLPLAEVGFWFPCPASPLKARLRARAWHATRACHVKDEHGTKAMHTYRDALEETYSGAWFASYEHLWDVVDNNNGQLPQRCNSKHGANAHQKAVCVCLSLCLSVSLSLANKPVRRQCS